MNILVFFLLAWSFNVMALEPGVRDGSRDGAWHRVSSSPQRMVLLELYTSEGCSSCPPAERFLSRLKKNAYWRDRLVPLAFHVTYWDYLGWKDPYAMHRFDERQRQIAADNRQRTVYTPQFVVAGKDFRRYKQFDEVVRQLASETAGLTMTLGVAVPAQSSDGSYRVTLDTGPMKEQDVERLQLFIAVTEDGLVNRVAEGENEGKTLHHDAVVRALFGPYEQPAGESGRVSTTVLLDPDWNLPQLGLVAFAQNPRTGEVYQAVAMPLHPSHIP